MHVRSAKERMRKFNSSSPAIEGEPSTGHQDTTLDLNLSCIGPGTSTSENTTVDLDVSCIEPGTSVNTSSCENTTVELNVSCIEPGTSTSENTTVDVNVSCSLFFVISLIYMQYGHGGCYMAMWRYKISL
ncbi:uncharacterized protein LOC141886737 [Acropora palmata]|uniref:uncharacterized protein LOC141886737 n=1 Tax=Acropora palmata TaxID=6131 RepID=UPI003DA07DCD